MRFLCFIILILKIFGGNIDYMYQKEIIWNINDNLLNYNYGEGITSKSESIGNIDFYLSIYPNGYRMNGYIDAYLLVFMNQDISKMEIQFTFKSNQLNIEFNTISLFTQNDMSWGVSRQWESKRLIGINDIVFICEFNIINIWDQYHNLVGKQYWNDIVTGKYKYTNKNNTHSNKTDNNKEIILLKHEIELLKNELKQQRMNFQNEINSLKANVIELKQKLHEFNEYYPYTKNILLSKK